MFWFIAKVMEGNEEGILYEEISCLFKMCYHFVFFFVSVCFFCFWVGVERKNKSAGFQQQQQRAAVSSLLSAFFFNVELS